jgi:hypothetical protein
MPRQATRKVTRRQAVALLGAGTVMSTVRAVPGSAEEAAQGNLACNDLAIVNTYRTGNTRALVSLSCCDETLNAVLAGVEEPKHRPTGPGKKHLKPLRDQLVAASLEEYCFMIWGLKKEQADGLSKSVPMQLGLEITTLSKPK